MLADRYMIVIYEKKCFCILIIFNKVEEIYKRNCPFQWQVMQQIFFCIERYFYRTPMYTLFVIGFKIHNMCSILNHLSLHNVHGVIVHTTPRNIPWRELVLSGKAVIVTWKIPLKCEPRQRCQQTWALSINILIFLDQRFKGFICLHISNRASPRIFMRIPGGFVSSTTNCDYPDFTNK